MGKDALEPKEVSESERLVPFDGVLWVWAYDAVDAGLGWVQDEMVELVWDGDGGKRGNEVCGLDDMVIDVYLSET